MLERPSLPFAPVFCLLLYKPSDRHVTSIDSRFPHRGGEERATVAHVLTFAIDRFGVRASWQMRSLADEPALHDAGGGRALEDSGLPRDTCVRSSDETCVH